MRIPCCSSVENQCGPRSASVCLVISTAIRQDTFTMSDVEICRRTLRTSLDRFGTIVGDLGAMSMLH